MDGESKNTALGLQPDGSVVVDRANDFAFTFLRSLDWNRPLRNTTSAPIWSDPSEWQKSMSSRHIRYEMADNFINLDNPTSYGLIDDLRKLETRKKNKKKKVDVAEFSLNQQQVREVKVSGDADADDEEDDFLDEFGNIKDPKESAAGETTVASPPLPPETVSVKVNEESSKKSGCKYRDRDGQIGGKGNKAKFSFLLEEPRLSHLNFKEQKVYLQLLERFRRCDSDRVRRPEDMDHYNVFISYQELVKEEQQEFQSFVKELFEDAMPKNREEIASKYLKVQARRYTEDHLRSSLCRFPKEERVPVGHLDTSDSLLRMLPFSNEQRERPQFEMRLIKPICEMGDIYKLGMPTFEALTNTKNPFRLTPSFAKVNSKFPTSGKSNSAVSEDPNIGFIFNGMHPPDIVIGTSALRTIFDNSPGQLDRSWEIPFTVKKIGQKSVILIDKPLPNIKGISALEKNRFFMRKAAKTSLIHPWSQSRGRNKFPVPTFRQNLPLVDYSDPFADVDVDLSTLETFGDEDSGDKSRGMPMQVDGANDLNSFDLEDFSYNFGDDGGRWEMPLQVDGATGEACDDSDDSDKMVIDDQPSDSLILPSAKLLSERRSTSDADFAEEVLDEEEKAQTIPRLPSPRITKAHTTDEDEDKDQKAQKRPRNRLDDILTTGKKKNRKGLQSQGGQGQSQGFLSGIMSAQKSMMGLGKHTPSDSPKTPSFVHQTLPFQQRVMHADVGDVNRNYQTPPEGKNVCYNLWVVRPKSEVNVMPTCPGGKEVPSIAVMTRSSVHCQVRGPGNSSERYTMSCKPEFQAQYGCEIMTRSELSREWISTLVRPFSKLARVRADAASHDVLTVEKKTLKDLTNDGAAIGFKPGEHVGNLYTLFKGMSTKIREEGRYVLVHDNETGPFVRVLKLEKDTVNKNLGNASNLETVDALGTQVWLPIDVNVVTPRHKVNCKVPGLFTPRKFEDKGSKSKNNKKYRKKDNK